MSELPLRQGVQRPIIYLEGNMEFMIIIYIAFIIAVVAGTWKAFEKAGEPGWAAIIPIYNFYIMTKMAGKPAWWIVLLLIPIVNLITLILISIPIAQKFGKGDGFGIGMAFLPFVFWPILGFGDATWQGSTNAVTAGSQMPPPPPAPTA